METNREKVAAPACAGNLAGAVCKRPASVKRNDLERLPRALIMGTFPPRDNTHKLKRSRTTSARDRWRLWRE